MLTKPRVSLVREDMEDDSQTFFYGSWRCHRTGSQLWTIHNPRKNAYTLRLLPIQLHVRGSCVVFSRHVTKQRSDWPELFGMARTKESAQRYLVSSPAHFRSPFCNGPKGGLAHLLDILIPPLGRLPKSWQAPPCLAIRNLAASFAHLRESYLGILSNEIKL